MAIALLTDFGLRDPYVAAMKGVIASRCGAVIHDLTHEIEPFDVFGASFFLREVEGWWPEGTIFVCVVDPGVGSDRRIVALESGKRIFLAPDNGLLTFVRADAAWSVENDALFLPGGSATFHGRDRFAPVAAALASGLLADDLGPRIGAIERIEYREPVYGDAVQGTIIRIDRFGNAVTDVEVDRVPFRPFRVRIGANEVGRLVRTYAEGGEEPFAIIGSSRTVELSCRGGSAAARLGIRTGQRLELLRTV